MRVLSVVGARPQFVKLAPITHALVGRAEHVVVHTGQHYDELMSEVFFRDLNIPAPDINLAIGSGAHGAQTAAMLAGLEPALERYQPDWVLVYGDTNSTLAAAIAAVKLHLPLAHLEAGLRSFNRRMPEEHNRVLTDHAADLLLAPTAVAMGHLADRRTGITQPVGRRRDDGRVVQNAGSASWTLLRCFRPASPPARFYVATVHRPDNTDSADRLTAIVDGLAALDAPVLLLVHPRLAHLAAGHGIDLARGAIRPIEPLAYPQLVWAVQNSCGVITDSGGLQKEAFLLRVPCTTIRPETEWVETVELGWNVLVSSDLSILAATVQRDRPMPTDEQPYGDGDAAHRVVDALVGSAG